MSDRGPWIQSYSGRRLYPLDCRAEDLHLEDIAHSLSLICRFGGHCAYHYSVAQHSVLVADEVNPRLRSWGLMHDAAEMLIGDICRPIKKTLPTVNEAEDDILNWVMERFGLPPLIDDDWKELTRADEVAISTEVRDLMGGERARPWHPMPKPRPQLIQPMTWQDAKGAFLLAARTLGLR